VSPGVGVERLPFDDELGVESDAEDKDELLLPDNSGLEYGLIAFSGGPDDRSPSAFRFVPMLVLMELLMAPLMAGLLTRFVASATGFVGFAGVGLGTGLGGAGDLPVPMEPSTSLKKLILMWRTKGRAEHLWGCLFTVDGL
jgi:hypothetical protein